MDLAHAARLHHQGRGARVRPDVVNDLRHFPRWLFRHLFEVNDYELDVALAVSRRLNDLKRGEGQRLLVKCENWPVVWRPRKPLVMKAPLS